MPASAAVVEAVRRHARRTPLLAVPTLADRLKRPVFLKAESLQVTGSFKVRGAAARLEALAAEAPGRGVVACSSGNHGRAVSWVAGRVGLRARVFVPTWVDPVKLEGIRAGGAEAVLSGDTFDASEEAAVEAARAAGDVYVSAYDDPWVIAGQGTIALEVVEQLGGRAPGTLVAALSGGGLLGGIGRTLRAEAAPGAAHTRLVGVSAERAAVMLASLRAGRPVELPEEPTLANALAGGIGRDNRWSFELIRDVVDEHLTVTEGEIADAMRYAVRRLRLVVEGGGAVGLAAALGDRLVGPDLADGPVVIVVSGGNVGAETLAGILGGS